MDIVYIRNLKIPCTIGVWDWERRMKQTVIIDLEMATDVRPAAKTDRLDGRGPAVTAAVLLGVRHARRLAPGAQIIVRTRIVREIDSTTRLTTKQWPNA